MYIFLAFIMLLLLISSGILLIMWVIKKALHLNKWSWIKWWTFIAVFAVAMIIAMVEPHFETSAQKADDRREDVAESRASAKKKAESESKKAASESAAKAKISKKSSESRNKAKKSSSIKKENKRKATSESKKKAHAKAKSVSKAKKDSESNPAASYLKKYKYVSLEKLTENPYKYDAGLIKTTGNVVFIQRNHDDSNMYYVVIAPKDSYSSSGYSDGHGSVTEIDVDTMKEHSIHEGDKITVYGSVMEDTVKLNGRSLKTDIIVDSVSK